MSSRGYLGAGDLYINRYVSNVLQGWEGPFETEKFELKANSELKELTSRGRYTFGQVIESVPIPKPFDLNVTLSEVGKSGLMMALMGTAAALNQTSGSLAAETLVAKIDKWVPLSKANFNGVVTVTNSGATVTYVENTDYTLNRTMGWLQVLAGGAIADLASLRVSGAYLAITGDQISGATQTQMRAQFRLDGVNFADGLPTIVQVHEAVISSDAAVDFLSDNFNKIPLKGRVKTPSGFTSPFTIDLRAA